MLQAVANVKGMVGDKAIGAYCISMAQSADDVFEVLFLGWLINRGLVLKTDDGWQVRACDGVGRGVLTPCVTFGLG